MHDPGSRDAKRADVRKTCNLLTLGWTLLHLGAYAFGGLGATLALLQRELVDKRAWLQPHDIAQALAFTKVLPGSTGVQVVAFLGWRLRGWPGAVIAGAAFVTPAAAMMTAAAAALAAVPDEPWINGALGGLQVAVIGLLASAMWKLARGEAKGRILTFVLLASCGIGIFVNAAFVVIGAGLLGALLGGRIEDA